MEEGYGSKGGECREEGHKRDEGEEEIENLSGCVKFRELGGRGMDSGADYRSCAKRLVKWRCRIWMSMVYVKIFRTHLQIFQQLGRTPIC